MLLPHIFSFEKKKFVSHTNDYTTKTSIAYPKINIFADGPLISSVYATAIIYWLSSYPNHCPDSLCINDVLKTHYSGQCRKSSHIQYFTSADETWYLWKVSKDYNLEKKRKMVQTAWMIKSLFHSKLPCNYLLFLLVLFVNYLFNMLGSLII